MKKKKRSFWADGFSIDETKFSTLMFMSVVGFIYALYSHYKTGDITGNLLDLFKFLVLSVVGVNGVNAVTNVFTKKREDTVEPPYNGDAGEVSPYEQDQNNNQGGMS